MLPVIVFTAAGSIFTVYAMLTNPSIPSPTEPPISVPMKAPLAGLPPLAPAPAPGASPAPLRSMAPGPAPAPGPASKPTSL